MLVQYYIILVKGRECLIERNLHSRSSVEPWPPVSLAWVLYKEVTLFVPEELEEGCYEEVQATNLVSLFTDHGYHSMTICFDLNVVKWLVIQRVGTNEYAWFLAWSLFYWRLNQPCLVDLRAILSRDCLMDRVLLHEGSHLWLCSTLNLSSWHKMQSVDVVVGIF